MANQWVQLSGSGAQGATGSSGGSGGTGTPAPNITSSTAITSYFLYGNGSSFGFSGIITLPTSDPDYAHLKSIEVWAFTPGDTFGTKINVIPSDLFSGSTVAWAGGTFQQPISAESWSLRFVVYNEFGSQSASPYTISAITVSASAVTGFTSAADSGVRTADPITRLVATAINFVPILNIGIVPQNVTYWMPGIKDPTKYVWIGWSLMETVGQTITVNRLVPAATTTWHIYCAAGAIGGDGSVEIAAGSLPPTAVISSGFSVAGLAVPLATDVTSLSITAGAGGSWPYNTTTEDGSQYFEIPAITYTDTGCLSDPNAFFIRITAQDMGVSGAVGPEQAFAGIQVSQTGQVQVFGPLIGPYGDTANPPRTANIAAVRLKVYSCNRIDQTTISFSNPACATLQTGIGSGAGYVDITVASGGIPPSGKLVAGRLDPTTLGRGVDIDPISGDLALSTDNTANMLLNSSFENGLKDWTDTYGTFVVTASYGAYAGTLAANFTGGPAGSLGQILPAVPGQQYLFSFMYYSFPGATGTGNIIINLLDGSGALITQISAALPTTPFAWTYTSLQSSITPAGCAFVGASIIFNPGAATNVWNFDRTALSLQPYLAAPLSYLGKQITIANQALTNTYIATSAADARVLAAASVTAANNALDAGVVVDSKVTSVGVAKLISGTVIFTGTVVLSRGSALPVIVLDNTGVYLFGVAASGGASGLTSQPYVAIQSGGIGIFQSASAQSVTINGSSVNLWTVNGNTGFPYVTLSSAGIIIQHSTFSMTISSSQIQMLHTSGASATLNTSNLILQNGSYSVTVSSTQVVLSNGAGGTLLLTSSSAVVQQGSAFVSISGGVILMSNGSTVTLVTGGVISCTSVTISGGLDMSSGSGVINFPTALSTGAASAGGLTLPSNPANFMTVSINGSSRKIPLYFP